jgi:hypothetical protein
MYTSLAKAHLPQNESWLSVKQPAGGQGTRVDNGVTSGIVTSLWILSFYVQCYSTQSIWLDTLIEEVIRYLYAKLVLKQRTWVSFCRNTIIILIDMRYFAWFVALVIPSMNCVICTNRSDIQRVRKRLYLFQKYLYQKVGNKSKFFSTLQRFNMDALRDTADI